MAPVTVGVLSVKVLPEQIGPLLLGDGVAGIALTVTMALPVRSPTWAMQLASVSAVTV